MLCCFINTFSSLCFFYEERHFYYWLILVSPSRDFKFSSLIQNRSLLYIPFKRILKYREGKGSFLVVYITELVTVLQGMSVSLLINYYIMTYLISLLYIMINQCFRNIFYTLLISPCVEKKINKKILLESC